MDLVKLMILCVVALLGSVLAEEVSNTQGNQVTFETAEDKTVSTSTEIKSRPETLQNKISSTETTESNTETTLLPETKTGTPEIRKKKSATSERIKKKLVATETEEKPVTHESEGKVKTARCGGGKKGFGKKGWGKKGFGWGG